MAVGARPQTGVAEVPGRVVGLLERAQHERAERDPSVPGASACGAPPPGRSPPRAPPPGRGTSGRAAAVWGPRARPAAPPAARSARARGARARGTDRGCRGRRAARRRLRWRRSSGSRSGDGTPSARAARSRPARRCSSKLNSGSSDSTVSAPARSRSRASAPAAARATAERLRPRLLRALLAGEDPIDAVVVQARVGADQRAVEGAAADPPVLTELELDGHRQTVGAGHQRAGVAGERVREHRLDRPGDVDAGGPAPGLAVQRAALGDVGADVGDVHPDPVQRRPPTVSAEIASSKSRALAGSIVKVASERRSRRSPGDREAAPRRRRAPPARAPAETRGAGRGRASSASITSRALSGRPIRRSTRGPEPRARGPGRARCPRPAHPPPPPRADPTTIRGRGPPPAGHAGGVLAGEHPLGGQEATAAARAPPHRCPRPRAEPSRESLAPRRGPSLT